MRFLVIQQKMIGDVLASTVICESLKYHFPKANVHLVANENTLAVLEGNPFIDEIIVFQNKYRESKGEFYNFLRSLRKREYNAILDAYGKLESNLITLFSNSDTKIGNHKWYTSWIYSKTIRQTRKSDGKIPLSISNRLMLLEPLVSERVNISFPKIYLSKEEVLTAKKAVSGFIDKKRTKLIMIGILGSAPHKTYPPKYMARLLDFICKQGNVKLLFNYIPKQREEALLILNLCSTYTQNCIAFDFYAESLRTFLGILSQCDLLIGNEGGAVNMAKALNIPSFSIFSPSIGKKAWHGQAYQGHTGVHLRDYHPELLLHMDKKALKNNSANLYEAYKPELFQQTIQDFLFHHGVTPINI